MSGVQRLGFLAVAIVIAVVAAVLLLGGEDAGDPENTGARATAPPTATAATTVEPDGTATATPTPTATPRPQPPLIRSGRVTRLRFEQGETIRFRVRSDVQEEVHVHGYDRYVDVPAGETVSTSFAAEITGIFEVELHGTGEVIAQLRVDPA